MTRFRPATNSAPLPRSTPSVSQTSSTFGEDCRKRAISGSASVRSTACGFGLICLSATRAAPATCSDMSRVVSDSGNSATPRSSASARAIISSAVRMRSSQVPAAAQPSSISISSGAERSLAASGGFHNGPAAAMTISAASMQPQQDQPPRRARRRLFLGRDLEQQPRRREVDAARPRRHQPQQPPQHRQRQQPEQHQRLGEGERQGADHAALPGCVVAAGALASAPGMACAPMRACSASSSSVAGRSVR